MKVIRSRFIENNREIFKESNTSSLLTSSTNRSIVSALSDIPMYFDSVRIRRDPPTDILLSNTLYLNSQNFNGEGNTQVVLDIKEDDYIIEGITSRIVGTKRKTNRIKKPDITFLVNHEIHCYDKWVADYYCDTNTLNMVLPSSYSFLSLMYSCIISHLVKQNIIKHKPFVFVETNYTKESITVGVDGELEFIDKSGNRVDTEGANLGIIQNSRTAPIGLDYYGGPVELRPKAGKTSKELVSNLQGLFREIASESPHVRLSTIGDVDALGCHIHFGLGRPIEPDTKLLRLLDYFIGNPLISLSGRARSDYRILGAWEQKDHGFEYRSTPSAIMENPTILKVVCKIGKKIVEAFYSDTPVEVNDLLQKYMYVHNDLTNLEVSATKEEYLKIGLTEYEVEYFFKFIGSYKEKTTYKRSTIAAWSRQKR